MLGGHTNRWTNVNYKFQVIGFSPNSPNLDCPQATGFLCILAKTLLWVYEEQGVHTPYKTHSNWVSLSNGFILHRKHKFSPHQCNSANSDFHRWYSMLKFHYFGLLVPCFQNRKILQFSQCRLSKQNFIFYLPFSSVTCHSGGRVWDGQMDISYTICVLLLMYNSPTHKYRCCCS
jgi:hypothetical protein